MKTLIAFCFVALLALSILVTVKPTTTVNAAPTAAAATVSVLAAAPVTPFSPASAVPAAPKSDCSDYRAASCSCASDEYDECALHHGFACWQTARNTYESLMSERVDCQAANACTYLGL